MRLDDVDVFFKFLILSYKLRSTFWNGKLNQLSDLLTDYLI